MESSRYLCAIKVLYTGRATFEIKGGDRTSVLGEAKTVNSSRPSSSLLLFSLFRIVPQYSASFIYERSDRFTYNDRWQVTVAMEEKSLGKTSRRGRTNERLRRDKTHRLILYIGCYNLYVFFIRIKISIYKYKYIYICPFVFQSFCQYDSQKRKVYKRWVQKVSIFQN